MVVVVAAVLLGRLFVGRREIPQRSRPQSRDTDRVRVDGPVTASESDQFREVAARLDALERGVETLTQEFRSFRDKLRIRKRQD